MTPPGSAPSTISTHCTAIYIAIYTLPLSSLFFEFYLNASRFPLSFQVSISPSGILHLHYLLHLSPSIILSPTHHRVCSLLVLTRHLPRCSLSAPPASPSPSTPSAISHLLQQLLLPHHQQNRCKCSNVKPSPSVVNIDTVEVEEEEEEEVKTTTKVPLNE